MWIGHTDFNTNNEVSKLQLFLIDKGYLPNETPLGYYGPLTASAITKFQLEKGIVTGGTLSTTGIGGVGPRTIGAIQDASCY
jgi:peptidoglycan hydrolase-like protein with peptidoglycan-binding domain